MIEQLTTWQPWTSEGDRIICAPEPEWTKPLTGRVVVGCDLFADGCEVFDEYECPMWISPSGNLEYQSMPGRSDFVFYESGCKRLRVADLTSRVFQLIDANPSTTFLVPTAFPERVRDSTPPWDLHACETGDCPHWCAADCDPIDSRRHRHNLYLYALCSTQAEADARVPELLKLSDLTPITGVWLRGMTEGINLLRLAEEKGLACPGLDALDHVIIEGTDQPLHPAHVRSVIEQCQAAGVPFFFKQWGEWLPEEQMTKERVINEHGWPEWEWPKATASHFTDDGFIQYRVGKHAAGRVLDGREWNEFPEVN